MFESTAWRRPGHPRSRRKRRDHAFPASYSRVDRRPLARECDPCLVTRISVNGASFTDTCCGSVNGGFAGPFDALAAHIDMLVERSAR
jgi:hypothetical protein